MKHFTEIKENHYTRIFTAAAVLLTCCILLTSCARVRDFFRKKADITFDANSGTVAAKYIEKEKDSGDKTVTGDADRVTVKCFVGDTLPEDVVEKPYYTFTGWYTKKEGGKKIISCPEKDATCYAQWESANLNRFVEIKNIKVSTEASPANKENLVRISPDSSKNSVTVTFTLSEWFGQRVAFTDKKGKVIQEIDVSSANGEKFSSDPVTVSCKLPDRNWMDRKSSSYYIRSFGNDHVDKGDPVRFRIKLDGQYEHFDKPVEGSMVWYGGDEKAPEDRTAVILATDKNHVYARHESTNETEDGSIIYKWRKSDCMINLADVRTDIVYDIYNAYSSRFFPIRGKAMYMDNGGKGLKRYEPVSRESAMHKNDKTGKTTFMVPVQWDFAEKVALAQSRARDAGVTLYIVDSFRPATSVDPVAKKVKDASLLAYGGTSAHNFGTAVDTGWQRVNGKGEPVGEPYVKNLQELDKKKAVKGPRGNSAEIWWQGVHKLRQEWWHYGDTNLDKEYRSHAKRVAELYVNQGDCLSAKRSTLD